MPSRREYLELAAAGIGGGGFCSATDGLCSEADVDLDELYRTAFTDSDAFGEEVSLAVEAESGGQADLVAPYTDIRTPTPSDAVLRVYDWNNRVAIHTEVERADLQVSTSIECSMEEARELRDLLTVAISAHEEWGIEFRPGHGTTESEP